MLNMYLYKIYLNQFFIRVFSFNLHFALKPNHNITFYFHVYTYTCILANALHFKNFIILYYNYNPSKF